MLPALAEPCTVAGNPDPTLKFADGLKQAPDGDVCRSMQAVQHTRLQVIRA